MHVIHRLQYRKKENFTTLLYNFIFESRSFTVRQMQEAEFIFFSRDFDHDPVHINFDDLYIAGPHQV